MANKKNRHSVAVAVKGSEVIYLSAKDEEKGLDIILDLQGYKITAL